MFSEIDYLSLLLTGAGINDSLLQAYRSFHLALQSILVAFGAGLMIAALSFDKFKSCLTTSLLLVMFGAFSLITAYDMNKVVMERGKDVTFWDTKVITVEEALPADKRYFTEFAIYQRRHRGQNVSYLERLFLTNEKILVIRDKDREGLVVEGHTRPIIDGRLFRGIVITWILLATISIGSTVHSYRRAVTRRHCSFWLASDHY